MEKHLKTITFDHGFVYSNRYIFAGERWRAMRCVLTSAFTANRVKEMHQNAVRCVEDYVHFLLQQIESGRNHSHIQILAGTLFLTN